LSRAFARQTVARNVTVNNLLPGIFDSDAQRVHVRAMAEMTGESFEQLWRSRAEQNPARRYGRHHWAESSDRRRQLSGDILNMRKK
jgi:NAD(P)-dependent dehydrogenase (short-subunit alcohol dehydrogenase family)